MTHWIDLCGPLESESDRIPGACGFLTGLNDTIDVAIVPSRALGTAAAAVRRRLWRDQRYGRKLAAAPLFPAAAVAGPQHGRA
jgi:hypothetical protein